LKLFWCVLCMLPGWALVLLSVVWVRWLVVVPGFCLVVRLGSGFAGSGVVGVGL
jgi:hypothetical protein